MYYQLTDRFEVRAGPEEVWRYFSAAENLAEITPRWLRFRIVTPRPVVIGPGALIDYRIGWLGGTLRWRTRIIDWSPPRQFVDLQVRGPYALWHHQHTFEPTPAGTVACADRVIYRLPLGPVGRLAHRLAVRKQLVEIFRFRRQTIARDLGWVRALQEDVQVEPL